MNSESPVVFVVDDDHRVREALSSLISSVGLRVAVFGSACGISGIRKAGCPRMPCPGLATSGNQRTGTPAAVVSRRYSADCLHLRSRRYPFFRARHQGWGDRVPSKTVRRSGTASSDSRRHRSGSNRAAERDRNWPNCKGATTFSRLANGKSFPSWWPASPTSRLAPTWVPARSQLGFTGDRSCERWPRNRWRSW